MGGGLYFASSGPRGRSSRRPSTMEQSGVCTAWLPMGAIAAVLSTAFGLRGAGFDSSKASPNHCLATTPLAYGNETFCAMLALNVG